ncbi:MAG: protein kinase [Acidobacteria bacterium]|nr:protein kinase [Acidobacteriota bacterium]
MIGQLVGNYKIIDKLGEGGMGEVFKGIDLMLEREVAIKMLRPELARQQSIVERFRAEAITLARLNHPNIATLYNFARQGNDFFMVMEYVKGHTFERLLKQSGAMPYQRAVQLFAQALDGMAHAHRLGIIHRDVKPANVMLMDAGLIKVMDFGIARVLGSNRITRTGNVIGTIEYMSPEQIRGEATDARADIYSLGILLYEMLTGRVPFDSSSEYELMRRQVEDAPLPPRTFTKEIPLALEQVIMRALAKKPEARFQTADEFRAVMLKNVGAATARLMDPSAAATVRQPTPAQAAPVKVAKPKKPVVTTLDFVSDTPEEPLPTETLKATATLQETRLPDPAKAILKETKRAEEAQQSADAMSPQAHLKATRLAEEETRKVSAPPVQEVRCDQQNQGGALRQGQAQALNLSAKAANLAAADSLSAATPEKKSPVAVWINKLTWKHYVAVMGLALLSIPLALIASSGHAPPRNNNQAVATKNAATLPAPKNEAVTQTPAPAPAKPVTTDATPDIETTPTPAPGATINQDAPPETARNNKKTRRAETRQTTAAREPAKRRERQEAENKEGKKKEKKGGLFGKVKGGLKKLNPFKKD